VPIDQIDRDGQQNHRLETPTSKAKIRSLADDFARGGPAAQLQPVRLYDHAFNSNLPPLSAQAGVGPRYLLGFGFRRVAAAELAGWTHVRAEVLPMPADPSEVERVRAVENLQRDDLTPVEEMMAVLAFVDALPTHDFYRADGERGDRDDDRNGPLLPTRDDDRKLRPWAVEHVARAVGRDAKWIRDRLYLDRLGPKARKRLVDGKLLTGHAREIAKLGDHAVQEIAAGLCEVRPDGSCQMTLDQLRRYVEQHQRSLKVVPWLLDAAAWPKDKRILGACATCPHNSSNDRQLFEHDQQPAQDGFCLHDACFDAKQAVSNKAVERAVETIVRKDLPANEASAASVAAGYVKPARVAREAKKAKEAPGEVKTGGEQGGEEEPAAAQRDPTPEEQARADLATATEKWIQESGDAIHEATLADPMKLAAVLLIEHHIRDSWNLSDADVTGRYREAFELLAKGDVEGVRGLAKLLADGDPDIMILGDLPEAAVDLLVRPWKLPVLPRPTLADFMPKPKEPEPVMERREDGPSAWARAEADDTGTRDALPAKVKRHKFDADVADVLRTAKVEGNKLILTCGQLDRKVYAKVNKSIELMGGKWNRFEEAHVFAAGDPAPALAAALGDGHVIDRKQTFQFFETPPALAERMVELANCGACMPTILEPSAGRGAIVAALKRAGYEGESLMTVVELDPQNTPALLSVAPKARTYLETDFLKLTYAHLVETGPGQFDRILMNPPFTRGQDTDHVRHAFELLKPGGRLVAIMSTGPFHRADARSVEFREWLDSESTLTLVEDEELPPGTFADAGTNVSARLIVLDKAGPKLPPEDFAEETPIEDARDLGLTEREIFAADGLKALERMGDKTPPKLKTVDPLVGEGKYRDEPAGRGRYVVLGTATVRGVECARLLPVMDYSRWQGETYLGGAARARVAAGDFGGVQVKVGRAVMVIDEPRWALHVRVGKGGGGDA
jgi:predicted RNA methylase